MKLKDTIKLNLIHIFRNSKNKYYILASVILSTLLLFILNFKTNMYNYINNTIIENVGFRTILIGPNYNYDDYGLNTIKNMNHISYTYSSKYASTSIESSFKNNYFDGIITLMPSKLIDNNNLSNGEAICPINFYPSSSADELLVDNSKSLSGRSLLNKTFTIKYNDYLKELKIISLYDSVSTSTIANTCYVSYDLITEIKDYQESSNEGVIYGIIAVVDKKENVTDVLNKLTNLGFDASIQLEADTSMFNNINIICNALTIIISLALILIIYFYIKKKIYNDNKNIGILRSIGFNKLSLYLYYLNEILLLSLISFIISVIIFISLFFLIKYIYINKYINKIVQISLYLKAFLIPIIIIIILPLLATSIMVIKKIRCNIITLIGGKK